MIPSGGISGALSKYSRNTDKFRRGRPFSTLPVFYVARLVGEGAPYSTGRLWKMTWGGAHRISFRLDSAMCSAVSFVSAKFFVLDVAIGLIAVAVVSFRLFSPAFGIWSFSGCGGFVASVLVLALGVGFACVRWLPVCFSLFVCAIQRPLL